jgi:hypothetical protein
MVANFRAQFSNARKFCRTCERAEPAQPVAVHEKLPAADLASLEYVIDTLFPSIGGLASIGTESRSLVLVGRKVDAAVFAPLFFSLRQRLRTVLKIVLPMPFDARSRLMPRGSGGSRMLDKDSDRFPGAQLAVVGKMLIAAHAAKVVRLVVALIQINMMDMRAPWDSPVEVRPNHPMQSRPTILKVWAASVIPNPVKLLNGLADDIDVHSNILSFLRNALKGVKPLPSTQIG